MQPVDERTASWMLLWTVASAYGSVLLILAVADLAIDLPSAGMLAQILAVLSIFLIYAIWRRMIILPAASWRCSLPACLCSFGPMRRST